MKCVGGLFKSFPFLKGYKARFLKLRVFVFKPIKPTWGLKLENGRVVDSHHTCDYGLGSKTWILDLHKKAHFAFRIEENINCNREKNPTETQSMPFD